MYGTDYFGRSVAKGYGNVHLPRTDGIHQRKIRIFKPLEISSVWACLNFCSATSSEFKDAGKVLTGENRENIKGEYLGEIEINVEVIRENFQRLGYE